MTFERRPSVNGNALAFETCPLPEERATAKWRELPGEGS